jgi:ADP-L-glycero-D-manno-heptose 6-epimerase
LPPGQLKETGRIRTFEGSGNYGPGEQRRDFVYVRDLARMNLHFANLAGDKPPSQGIFNAGSDGAKLQ